MRKRSIGIVRVSSAGQKDGYGPQTQEEELRAKARELDLELLDVWQYQESATNAQKRPQFDNMLHKLVAMGQAGDVDVVIFGRPDRLGRDGEQAFFYYTHLLEQIGGLQVRFARDDIDPNDPYRNFKLFMEAFKATRDAETIKRNTAQGRKARGASGKLPNGQVPWPFDYDSRKAVGDSSSGIPTINAQKAEWVKRWVQWLLAEKLSLRSLCKRMMEAGVPAPKGGHTWRNNSVSRVLKNRALLGEFYAQKEGDDPKLILKDANLAIITEQEFDAIQAIFRENRSHAIRNTKRDYTPLHGFVWCYCGRKALATPMHGFPYFRCNVCRKPVVHAKKLWSIAKTKLSFILTNPERVLSAMRDSLDSSSTREELEQRRDVLRAELASLDKSLEKVIRAFSLDEGYGEDIVKQEVARIRMRRETVLSEIGEVEACLESDNDVTLNFETLSNACYRIRELLAEATKDDWQAFMREFGFKAIIQPKPPHVLKVSVSLTPSEKVVTQRLQKLGDESLWDSGFAFQRSLCLDIRAIRVKAYDESAPLSERK